MRHLLTLLLLVTAVQPSTFAAADPEPALRDAIVAAVRERLGPGTVVIVEAVSGLRTGAQPPFLVRFAPSAKLGPKTALLLTSGEGASPRQATQAAGAHRPRHAPITAALRISVDHWHTRAALRRGIELSASDLVAAHHAVGTIPARAWPTLAELSGGRAARDLGAGECLRAGSVIPRLAVRTGDHVVAIARVDGIEARSTLVATTGGRPGTVVRVLNPVTRRALRARVLEPGVVEMVQD